MKPTIIMLALVAGPASAFADVTLSDADNQQITHECTGDDTISVSSNKNRLILSGTCKLVIVSGNENVFTIAAAANIGIDGNANRVIVDRADRIYVPGNGNSVHYRRALTKKSPTVANPGNGNRIRRGR